LVRHLRELSAGLRDLSAALVRNDPSGWAGYTRHLRDIGITANRPDISIEVDVIEFDRNVVRRFAVERRASIVILLPTFVIPAKAGTHQARTSLLDGSPPPRG
jgi:hypothetical protein